MIGKGIYDLVTIKTHSMGLHHGGIQVLTKYYLISHLSDF